MKLKGRRQSENIRDARGKYSFKWDDVPGKPVKDPKTAVLAKELEEALGIGKQKLPEKGPIPPERPNKKDRLKKTQVTPGEWKTKSK